MKAKYWTGFLAAVAFFVSAQASATLIDFEDAPSHGLADNGAVTNEYAGAGITFVGAILEHAGAESTPGNKNGFLNDVTGNSDNPVSSVASQLGDWFLRSSHGHQGHSGDVFLTVNYASAVTAASGDIWDIDGNRRHTEKWRVEAWSNGIYTGAFALSPLGDTKDASSLNGRPWTFNLSYGGGFDQLRFVFLGSKTDKIGLAFDHFNTNSLSVPEPAALGVFGLGALLIGLFAGLRRRIG